MECWICKRPAQAICIFCGRAVCQEHSQLKPSVKNLFRDESGKLQAVIVDGSIWCGKCRPLDYPIDISEFDPAKTIEEKTESKE